MKKINKEKLEKLYKGGLSMKEISDITDYNYKQIVYWMNKYNISRRTISEAIYIKKNPNGDPFKFKINLTPKERELRGLGLGLYWGEGEKTKSPSVRLGNTDPVLIKRFIDFLLRICGVNKSKLKYSLQIFNDSNIKEAVKFWSNQLNINENSFGKVTIMQSRGVGTYKNKNKTGVLTVYVHNKKLKEKILDMLG